MPAVTTSYGKNDPKIHGRVRVGEKGMTRRVGIVGIGIMGTAMVRNLLRDGFEVAGYDIAEAAMARLAEAGGAAAASPRDVAEKAEILIASLPSVDAFGG